MTDYESRVDVINDQIHILENTVILLEAAERDYTLFRVPTHYDDYHNGDEVRTNHLVWAKDYKEAKFRVACDNTDFDKSRQVEIVRETPIFNKDWSIADSFPIDKGFIPRIGKVLYENTIKW